MNKLLSLECVMLSLSKHGRACRGLLALALTVTLALPIAAQARGHHSHSYGSYHSYGTHHSYHAYHSHRAYHSYSTRSHYHRIHRNAEAKDEFKRMTGFPHGRRGYVIDHIIPLACGGADAPSNMQWQTIAAAKAKDKWERKGCSGGRRR